jgi:hypothetical protein
MSIARARALRRPVSTFLSDRSQIGRAPWQKHPPFGSRFVPASLPRAPSSSASSFLTASLFDGSGDARPLLLPLPPPPLVPPCRDGGVARGVFAGRKRSDVMDPPPPPPPSFFAHGVAMYRCNGYGTREQCEVKRAVDQVRDRQRSKSWWKSRHVFLYSTRLYVHPTLSNCGVRVSALHRRKKRPAQPEGRSGTGKYCDGA